MTEQDKKNFLRIMETLYVDNDEIDNKLWKEATRGDELQDEIKLLNYE